MPVFADINDVLNSTSPVSQMVEGQVHFMAAPWSFESMRDVNYTTVEVPAYVPWDFDTTGVDKFKIMGVSTC
jgi:hypothetical protein